MSGRHVDPSQPEESPEPEPGEGTGDDSGSPAGDDARSPGGVGAAAGGAGVAAGAAGGGVTRSGAAKPNRRRVLLIVAIAFLLIVAGVVIYALVSDRQQDQAGPQTPDPVTTTLPAPTPEGEPIEINGDGALAAALPTVVLDHVLTSAETDEDAYADHQALEGWFLTYSAPGSDIEVHVLQWPDAQDAVAHAEDFLAEQAELADGEGRRSGDVAVGGESVGRYEIGVFNEADQANGSDEPADPSTPADEDADPVATPEPLGPGMAVWTNGTVAFVATGDGARLAQFYDNFPF